MEDHPSSGLVACLLPLFADEDAAALIATEIECLPPSELASEERLFENLKAPLTEIIRLPLGVAEIISDQIFAIISAAKHSSHEDEDEGEDFGSNECQLCERTMPLTFHHLYPKKVHRRMERRKGARSEAFGIPKDQLHTCGIMICRPCHSMVHRTFDHRTLAEELNSLHALRDHPKMIAWISYASRQKESALNHGVLGLKYKR